MTNKITPERARELLNMAHQGAVYEQRPVTVAAKYAPLAEAAYGLAQTVANMHYEYAVQRLVDGEWKFTGIDGKVLAPSESERIAWWDFPIPKGDIADRGAGWRVVRRLAADPEVVE